MEQISYNPKIKETLDSFIEFRRSCFWKNVWRSCLLCWKKPFACVYEDGVGIKVPEDLTEELIGAGIIGFHPTNRAKMRQWIQINRKNPDDYFKDMEIFRASIDFVSRSVT